MIKQIIFYILFISIKYEKLFYNDKKFLDIIANPRYKQQTLIVYSFFLDILSVIGFISSCS